MFPFSRYTQHLPPLFCSGEVGQFLAIPHVPCGFCRMLEGIVNLFGRVIGLQMTGAGKRFIW